MCQRELEVGRARPANGSSHAWMDQEVGPGPFKDVRLDKRFRTLLEQLATGVGESIPWVCQDSREHQGGLSLSVQRARQRSRDSGRPF